MWIHSNSRGRARIYCRQRAKGSGCVNRGTFMDVYEAQIVEYLRRFVLPEDYRAQILGMYHHLQQAEGDSEGRRRELEGRLERIKYLYEWGDKTKEDYLSESREIKEELTDLTPPEQRTDVLGVFRVFLEDVAAAWEKGTDEQKNRLARQMFDIIWTKMRKWWQSGPGPNSGLSSRSQNGVKKKVCLATPTGFEPAISALTGQYVKPLHHGAVGC